MDRDNFTCYFLVMKCMPFVYCGVVHLTKYNGGIYDAALSNMYLLLYFQFNCKGKTNFSLCACHEGMLENGGIPPYILNLSTRWGKWSPSCFGHFIPDRTDKYSQTRGLGGPQLLHPFWRRENSVLCQELSDDSPVIQIVASHYIVYTIMTHVHFVLIWNKSYSHTKPHIGLASKHCAPFTL
jgi:hypothetical protein